MPTIRLVPADAVALLVYIYFLTYRSISSKPVTIFSTYADMIVPGVVQVQLK